MDLPQWQWQPFRVYFQFRPRQKKQANEKQVRCVMAKLLKKWQKTCPCGQSGGKAAKCVFDLSCQILYAHNAKSPVTRNLYARVCVCVRVFKNERNTNRDSETHKITRITVFWQQVTAWTYLHASQQGVQGFSAMMGLEAHSACSRSFKIYKWLQWGNH